MIDNKYFVDTALAKAIEEILKEELGYEYENLNENSLLESYKKNLLSTFGEKLKLDLVDIAKGEELSLDDLVELIIGLYMACKKANI